MAANREKRQRFSRLVMHNGQPVLRDNVYSMEEGISLIGETGQHSTSNLLPYAPQSKKIRTTPKTAPAKSRADQAFRAAKAAANATIAHDKASALLRRQQFIRNNWRWLSPFLGESCPAESEIPLSAQRSYPRLEKQPDFLTGVTMREYQLAGLNWLIKAYENGINGILGDEMGLGKTLQTISFLGWMKLQRGIPGPYLVVVPLSVLSNWLNEFRRFCPQMRVKRLHSSDRKTVESMLKQITKDVNSDFDVLITTYDLLKSPALQHGLVHGVHWRYVVFDEGHVMRNEDTQVAKIARKLHYENVLLLTGTPLQNNLHELWSLLNILMPEIFPDSARFDACFNISAATRYQVDKRLLMKVHALLKPFMLRRIKAEVEKGVPPKVEKKILCPMSTMQETWYKRLLQSDKDLLSDIAGSTSVSSDPSDAPDVSNAAGGFGYGESGGGGGGGGVFAVKAESTTAEAETERGKGGAGGEGEGKDMVTNQKKWRKLMMLMTQLRKVCNHPFLFEEADQFPEEISEALVDAAGKMQILDRLLEKLKRAGNRVVIFSQFTAVLDIIGDFLTLRGYDFCRLDGSTNRVQRQVHINSFNAPGSPIFIFIMSTRAGGLGVNLQTADTVILYDSDWNPQADVQAMARVHRIGQQKVVHVYRLVTAGTIEERIVQRAEKKLFLDQVVNRDGIAGKVTTAALDNELSSSSSSSSSNAATTTISENNSSSNNGDINTIDDEADEVTGLKMDELLGMLKFGAHVVCESGAKQEISDAELDRLIDRSPSLQPVDGVVTTIAPTTAAATVATVATAVAAVEEKGPPSVPSATCSSSSAGFAQMSAFTSSSSSSAAAAAAAAAAGLRNAQTSALEFNAVQAPTSLRTFQGQYYAKYDTSAGKSFTHCSSSMRDLDLVTLHKELGIDPSGGKRIRKQRLITVKDAYGVEHQVLARNDYGLLEGERSVFDRELKQRDPAVSYRDPKKKKALRAGVDYANEEHCLVCWDGGELLCCDACPASYHAACLGFSARDVRKLPKNWRCFAHKCWTCDLGPQAVGGLIFRCSECPQAFCEDHLPSEAAVVGRCFRMEDLGFALPSVTCFVHCGDSCAIWAEKCRGEKMASDAGVGAGAGACAAVVGADNVPTAAAAMGEKVKSEGEISFLGVSSENNNGNNNSNNSNGGFMNNTFAHSPCSASNIASTATATTVVPSSVFSMAM